MDKLQNFININRDILEGENIPFGDEDRFLKKFQKNSRIKLYSFLSIAASIVLFAGVTTMLMFQSPEYQLKNILKQYYKEVAMLTIEIENASSSMDKTSSLMIEQTIDNITFEAIPILSQLPDELNEKEKVKIVKEYYSQRLDGLRRLKTQISDSMI